MLSSMPAQSLSVVVARLQKTWTGDAEKPWRALVTSER